MMVANATFWVLEIALSAVIFFNFLCLFEEILVSLSMKSSQSNPS